MYLSLEHVVTSELSQFFEVLSMHVHPGKPDTMLGKHANDSRKRPV